ncbi:uncharacterized protein N7443_004857 [Penicillium atrosanguineum]|uniref:uncharacterized protein n=1 Tax=Penicillium atrosanguineum TaxID=1132637 RepID=UPI002391B2ED|nr:uncharacterized protein N7443_004857 [Penicillium atrosanguineum]KAJ5305197.1 hypothetical protein N7443_004857 [Penicillium atrosanguineum]
MAQIFLTGASGYIGGDVLHVLKSTHPEYQCSVLLRDSAKADAVSKAYPDVRIILGDLDNVALIEEEAAKADVVVHAASNSHVKSAEAIARGLAKHTGPKPGYWIQVSGASVLSISDIVSGRFGEGSDRVYGDIEDANEIRDIIKQNAAKRVMDDYVLNKVSDIKTALVFPPIIYGQGRGPVKGRSVQIPELSRIAIETRETVQVGKGESTWSNVHIADVADVFVKLIEKAIDGSEGEFWGQNGLYFVGNGMLISSLVAEAAHKLGLTDSPTVKTISASEANALWAPASVFCGTNACQKSERIRRLGWVPQGHSIEKEIPLTVQAEATRLGKL